MTDRASDTTNDAASAELAERIRRLQARRGPGSQPTRGAPRRDGDKGPKVQRSKARRRPGAASRILATGLSVTGFFSIVAAMGIARQHATPATSPAAPTPVTAAATGATAAPSAAAVPATAAPAPAPAAAPAAVATRSVATPAPVAAAPAPAPVTVTRGS